MSATLRSASDTRDYEMMTAVHYVDGALVVHFADDTFATVPVDRLAHYGVGQAEWSAAEIDDHHVRVPTASGDVEIPWDVVRYHSDATFRDDWDEAMRQASREAGHRLRLLRERQNLSTADVARRLGVAADAIIAIESGTPSEPRLEARILAALNMTYADLAALA